MNVSIAIAVPPVRAGQGPGNPRTLRAGAPGPAPPPRVISAPSARAGSLRDGGQFGDGAQVAGLGDAQAGVDVQGLFPVFAPGIVLAGGVACMGKPVVRAALLIAVARLAGQRQRGVMAGECLAGPAGGQVGFPASVERRGLSARIADLLVEGQCVLMEARGPVKLTLPVRDRAEPGQRAGLFPLAAGLTGEGERGEVEAASLVVLAGTEHGLPGAVEGLGFTITVGRLLEQFQRLPVAADCLVILAPAVADRAEPGQRPRLDTPAAEFVGQGKGLRLVVGGPPVLALPVVDLSQVGQRDDLAEPVIDLAVDADGLPHVAGRPLVTALPEIDKAQVGQGDGLAGDVAEVPAQGEGLAVTP